MHRMNKKAAIEFNLSSWADAGKMLTFALVGAVAAAGYATGKVYQKATEPTDTDFDNAQRAYGVGAAKASLRRQVHRLSQERGMIGNTNQKTMRIME